MDARGAVLRGRFAAIGLAGMMVAGLAAAEPRHGHSTFGDLKYPAGFRHFDYVNPAAPKGGEIRTWELDTFDSLHPLILKGVPAGGIDRTRGADWVFLSLLERALDEPDAQYGALADSMDVAADRGSARFTIDPAARWQDGRPVLAADVVFTFNAIAKDGHPRWKLVLQDVESVTADGERTVMFRFKPGESRRDMPGIVAGVPILPAYYFANRPFDRAVTDPPIPGSGPYRVERADWGRSITYRRNADWWARDKAPFVGRFNFDTIRHEYFRDRDIAAEAFFANAYDFRVDVTARHWATLYDDKPAVKAGHIRREELIDGTPSGVQGFFLNTRRPHLADPRVREALNLAFDFEWQNKNLFHGIYRRTKSMFANSELEAKGAPSAAELALLEPWRGTLDKRVFERSYEPPGEDGSGDMRARLRAAQRLLAAAGWTIKSGKLQNAKGEPFTLEFLLFEPSFQRIINPYIRDLERLGIAASIRMADLTAWQNRVQDYDFDIVSRRYSMAETPGIEQRLFWGGQAARTKGSYNIAGVNEPAVDALIERIVGATDRPTLLAATHALDRVLMWGHYTVPHWYSGKIRLATWDRFGKPDPMPRYMGSDSIIALMWYDAARAARLPQR
jgi:microcin C transport system substrate-binding protein